MRRWFIAPLIALLAATLLRPAMAQEDAPASIDRGAVEEIVRDYLLEHPEVLVEALTAYELKRREQAAAATGELTEGERRVRRSRETRRIRKRRREA